MAASQALRKLKDCEFEGSLDYIVKMYTHTPQEEK